MRKVSIRVCALANLEHQVNKRQYAHVFHRPGRICIARAFDELPDTHRLALLLHEVGHLLAGRRGGEWDADRMATEASGVPIYYVNSKYGEDLEWIKPNRRAEVREFLMEFIE